MNLEPTSFGKRLGAARRRQRMTQDQLASAAGMSTSGLRKIEQGTRVNLEMATFTKLADALGMPINELLGVQPGLRDDNKADVAAIRKVIYDSDSNVEPASLAVLHTQLEDLRALYWGAKFSMLTHHLPAHVAQARAAVRAANGGEDKQAAHAMLAKSLQLSASLVTHLTYEDLAHVALSQAVESARIAEDPLLLAAQHSTTAWVLTRQGLWSRAQHLATTAAEEIRPVLDQASPEHIGIWGGLLHFGMAALAREDRDDEAYELLGLIQSAGEALRGRTPTLYDTPFSETWAAHSAVQLAKDTGQPRKALTAAKKVGDPGRLPPSVHARYLLNVAWASSLEWKSQEALAALKQIETLAPEILNHHGLAREIVENLMPRRRSLNLPGLIGLAERTGVVE